MNEMSGLMTESAVAYRTSMDLEYRVRAIEKHLGIGKFAPVNVLKKTEESVNANEFSHNPFPRGNK
jgi:hypothetical protein